ncbi:MAG: thiamine pyrophosphate-dependent dehydrogenase E1 component subunit alpha [Candidatus Hodarchaeota archaeon]
MVRARLFDEKMGDFYSRGLCPGTLHLSTGQEAVAVGVCASLEKEDFVISTHRAHAHTIAKGAPMNVVAAEILGKMNGCCRGRGGTMHLSWPPVGMIYSSAIVGGGAPLAVGAALSATLRKTNQVAAAFFGDGATNIGGFHESLNLASLWKLPVVFVCENNLYAISVSVERSTSVKDIADRASAYAMPGFAIDGNDVIEVYKTAHTAVERARRGEGPTLIECKTYRWHGHYFGDPGTAYRTKEEVEAWKKKDPIVRLKKHLLERAIANEEELSKIEEKAKAEVEVAEKYAIESEFPGPEELERFIF